ncbi:TPA: hypothetical protein N0F65_011348 [Lagenidium giganteum]|uniref:Rab-GAP TBC domain-containing protein n=1 Tax=Lagenidium giganteum TaxID=4803 RepID=A0AAV2Z7E1_9STRA|nr:TPA: hypothetical protein N0F65_011348 [Lagenidium giganteum]
MYALPAPRSPSEPAQSSPARWKAGGDVASSHSTDAARDNAAALRRAGFWKNVVRQFNFTNEAERKLVISLTRGINWTTMKVLPKGFIQRHREIYHLISTPDYKRSSMIERDVTRTFSIFERSQMPAVSLESQQRALFRVLNAISEAEDGYCQGMNFIAALFLVEGIEEANAYALFLYLLKKRHLARIFQRSSTFLDDYLHHFSMMFEKELPDLYKHMHDQGFSIPMYGIEWFTTLFSLSTKLDLACAIFDLFFVGVHDIFLRMGLAILKLSEAKLMSMTFEDFLQDFKPLVRLIDPYQAVFSALTFAPNPLMHDEDTVVHVSRAHFQLSSTASAMSGNPVPPRTFELHRTLPPVLINAIINCDFKTLLQCWEELIQKRPLPSHCLVLANEILHYAVWFGQSGIGCFAIERCGADVNNNDDTDLTPLHFAVIRNQPDMVRLLLSCGADRTLLGGRWNGSLEGLTPLDTAKNWKFRDTTAARLVLEHEVCLYCNTKFDVISFSRETCRTCHVPFCKRTGTSCLTKHQCPPLLTKTHRRSTVADAESMAEDTATETLDEAGGSSDEGSDRRSSRSLSESSSFVFINSPVGVRSAPTNQLSDLNLLEESDLAVTKQGFLDKFNNWLSGFRPAPRPTPSNNGRSPPRSAGSAVEGPRLGFPDRPEWYCNASECHSVFAFFTHGSECQCCSGFFCSPHFDADLAMCVGCKKKKQLVVLSPK